MKKKIILVLGLGLMLTACQKENYISQRHPEENKPSLSQTKLTYTKKDKSNEISLSKEKKVSNIEEKNKSNIEKDKKQSKETNAISTEEMSQVENVEGIFTVDEITNIRQDTTTDSEVVAKLQPGNTVYRTEIDGQWSRVSFESYEGYILTELLIPATE